MTRLLPIAVLPTLLAVSCASGPPKPVPLDTRNEQCASCRMAVSDPRFAAQLVAPGELPLFFDDLGCLAAFVKAGKTRPGDVAFVADHRTRAWVRADRANYARVPGLATPMASRMVAHADAASRSQDPDAREAADVAAEELFGPAGSPAGGER